MMTDNSDNDREGPKNCLQPLNRRNHLSLDDVRLAHVPDTQQQVQLTVARTDDRSLAEHERLGALLGPRQLGDDQPGHQSVREDADTRLGHEQQDGEMTVGVHEAIAIADRLLRLDRER